MRFDPVPAVLALGLALTLPDLAEARKARGTVFHDVNGNGIQDAGEPGRPGVGVSNGRDIVTTKDDGRYEIDVDDHTIVFVLKPRGWQVPLDENQLPQFYYIHSKYGSPDLHYEGIAPTGPLPKRIDFPLTPQPEPERFRAILFGDPQVPSQREIDFLTKSIVEPLVGTDAAFGVTLGDILADDLTLFDAINRSIALIGIPWYNVLGNHDIHFDAKDDEDSHGAFEATYGPRYYSFDYGPVHFLVLDDVYWKGKVTDPDVRASSNYTGGLGKHQLEFIERDLERIPEDQLVVLFMHIPLVSDWIEPERARLFELMQKRPLVMSVAAHYHYQEHLYLTDEHGWTGPEPHHHVIAVTASGSWWRGLPDANGIPVSRMRDGAPRGYTMVTFDGSDYVMDFHPVKSWPHDHMHVWVPEPMSASADSSADVFVNVYNGSERSTVEYRLDRAGEWVTLAQTREADPHFLEAKARVPEDPSPYYPLTRSADSSHLWKAPLPAGLSPGTHWLDVRTTDAWGRTFESGRSFRVEE